MTNGGEKKGAVSRPPCRNKPNKNTPLLRMSSNQRVQLFQGSDEAFQSHLSRYPDRVFCNSELVILLGIVRQEEDDADILGVGQHRVLVLFLYLCQPLVSHLE